VLSRKAKYAINALVFLSRQKKGVVHQIAQIARSEAIPKKFLEIILLELKAAGIVQSKRGADGGYFLQKNPAEIHLAEVMRLMDGPIALLPCVSTHFYKKCAECKDEHQCGIRFYFQQVRDQTQNLLSGTSLQDIIDWEKTLN
jgi:Rrf2 family protein